MSTFAIEAHYSEDQKQNGIFTKLYQKFGRISSRYTVKPSENNGKEVTLIDKDKSIFWYDTKNMTFKFDSQIYLTSYTLENPGEGHSYLAEWKIMGSNDGSIWTELDYQNVSFCSEWCYSVHILNYQLNSPGLYSQIRIVNIRNSHSENHYLILRSCELFGVLLPKKPTVHMNRCRNNFAFQYVTILLLIS